ncbi:MAG: tRNA pseudouridine(38-40) synthase TruA [Prevotellaceae bacterium]|nr:tRNA pseudouridine(38-40) synthase TruA [Prevotellaceae bacterium]
MKRYFVYIKYDGTAYHGWQVQPNANSVQAELQRALSTLLREDVQVVGAGRTDTGVHARMMAAHFETEKDVDCEQMVYKLNRLLPRDISADKVTAVDGDMHARFSAVSRTYHYYVHLHKDPFLRAYSCELHYNLDFDKMNEAAALLTEYDDFASFCKSNAGSKTTICKVSEARWIKDGEYRWHFVITADRFLRNMVRAVVGTLVEVGRGRMSIDDFRRVVDGHSRSDAGESMPGNALFLEHIGY